MSEELQPVESERGSGRQISPRVVVAIVGLVLVVVFAAINAQTVTVDFLVDSFELPLVIVILAAAFLGGLIDRLLVVQRRRRLRRKEPA